MTQFSFDPATYLDLMRAEVPAYGRLQEAVADATVGVHVTSVLDLGTGTGETLAAVLERHGPADTPPAGRPLRPRRLGSGRAPPRGSRQGGVVRPGGGRAAPGGRFVLGDVVIPVDPADAVTPLSGGHDRPSTLAEQLDWLAEAGFEATGVWAEQDLVVVRADRPG